jgi:hypothetical protein
MRLKKKREENFCVKKDEWHLAMKKNVVEEWIKK